MKWVSERNYRVRKSFREIGTAECQLGWISWKFSLNYEEAWSDWSGIVTIEDWIIILFFLIHPIYNKVCLNRECVNVTAVYKSKCQPLCPDDQVCNNQGQCVCLDGGTSDCSTISSNNDRQTTKNKGNGKFFYYLGFRSFVRKTIYLLSINLTFTAEKNLLFKLFHKFYQVPPHPLDWPLVSFSFLQ